MIIVNSTVHNFKRIKFSIDEVRYCRIVELKYIRQIGVNIIVVSKVWYRTFL